MAILKCKMCGGNIEVGENQNIGVCDSCGSTMTIPNVNDERILNLFDRANHFRLQNEFDKALIAYESILSEDNKNAEAHWGCVLSKYGIEYVEDPKTHKRVPTCHRVQNESVLSDLDYKAAVEYTDDISAKNLYQQEAEAIAEIQKNILSIANNEAPYDVFICYKETDNNGRRTVDSTLAQDIYYQLTNEGYKVFFSRITLEDKLGTEYEPYIFSALNSAKVMLVIGTSKDYFNAVWVKNEWARFLDLARKDKSKMIIPCYRDMDAYDLPDELSMFQSQDMSKIGFIQDLIRGIKKVLKKETPQNVTVVNNTAEAFNSEAILKRAFMLLEDAEWQKADELLEQVLNHEPENASAYVGKLMIDVKVNKEENLGKRAVDFSENPNYQKAVRFADTETKRRLEDYRVSSLNTLKRLKEEKIQKENEICKQNEKNQEIQRHISEVVKSKRTAHKKALRSYTGILLVFSLIVIIISFKCSLSGWPVEDTGFICLLLASITLILSVSLILATSIPSVNKCMEKTTSEDFELYLDNTLKKHRKKAITITAIGVAITIILGIVSGNAIWKSDTIEKRFDSVGYITDMIKSSPSIETLKTASLNDFSVDNDWDYAGTYEEVSSADKIVEISDSTSTEVVLDKKNNIIGFTMRLYNIFNSMSINDESDMTEDDLKAKLGNYVRTKDCYPDFLVFNINGCNVYIEEDYEYDGFEIAFITKP